MNDKTAVVVMLAVPWFLVCLALSVALMTSSIALWENRVTNEALTNERDYWRLQGAKFRARELLFRGDVQEGIRVQDWIEKEETRLRLPHYPKADIPSRYPIPLSNPPLTPEP